MGDLPDSAEGARCRPFFIGRPGAGLRDEGDIPPGPAAHWDAEAGRPGGSDCRGQARRLDCAGAWGSRRRRFVSAAIPAEPEGDGNGLTRTVDSPQLERLSQIARRHLVLRGDDSAPDLWLWEHSARVQELTRWITRLPEVAPPADEVALASAALFHEAGWVVEVQQKRCRATQVLTRPTSDIQRELGAELLKEEAQHVLPDATLFRALEAIRQCGERDTTLPEARILADADALDEVGAVYVLRLFRQYQAEGRALEQLVETWTRQQEFQFWDLRLDRGFHYEATRGLARARLAAVGTFMNALAGALHAADVRAALADAATGQPAPLA